MFIIFSSTNVDTIERRWNTLYTIAFLIVGIALITALVIYEIYIPAEPLMPMQLFNSTNFCTCMAIPSFSWIIFFGVLNHNTAIYFEHIKGYSAIIGACCFTTQPIAGRIVNLFTGLRMHRIPGKVLINVDALDLLALQLSGQPYLLTEIT